MQQRGRFLIFAVIAAMVAAIAACAPTGVGDPCEPEVQPEGGFQPGETVLETSSLQCRTRICMYYNDTSFCTRRCETDEDCNADWYEEGPGDGDNPSAYCEAEVTVGSPAMLGTYCVPSRASSQPE